MNNPQSPLPPGFRFHPTDEELILHYLKHKIDSIPLPVDIIAEVDIYKFDPWNLPDRATFGEKEWYFFTPRDRKYPNGARPNRAAGSGYWKATGTDKIIKTATSPMASQNVGVKKALVFYEGRPPKGAKTNWIMHEYRLAESLCNNNGRHRKLKESTMRLDDWVLCRIYKKSNVLTSSTSVTASPWIDLDQEQEEPFTGQDTKLPFLPNFSNPNPILPNPLMPQKSSSFSNLFDAMDYSMLSSFLSVDPTNQSNAVSCFDPTNYVLDPALHYPVPIPEELPVMKNGVKRSRFGIDVEMLQSSKKLCNFANNEQFEGSRQYSLCNFNHSSTLLNQQLVLGSNFEFLG